jgi:diguanylate cyclase (GGDEF)-like protein
VRRGSAGDGGDTVLVEAVLDALPSPTLLIDAEGRVLLANAGWVMAADVLDDDRFRVGVGDDYFALVQRIRGDAAAQELVRSLRELSRGERAAVSADYAIPHPAGTRWYHLQASRVDQAGQVVVTHTDVTSRVQAEQTSSWQARHDHLTSLPNRAHLHELIDAELSRPDRGAITVLFLDVDGFKDVNDSLGHEVGDDLLRQLAARLAARTRGEDTVGRLGGDEFVVLCRNCDTSGAEALALRFQSAFDDPFELQGRTVQLSASIGIATTHPEGSPRVRSTDLVRDADLAMYAAKAAGRNRVRLFTTDLRLAVQQKVLLATELREAIQTGQLVLHFQPVMYLPTREITGVEALIRWQHPERGLLLPADFLPAAEEHDLLPALTRWLLGAATRQAATWATTGLHLVMGVNISGSAFETGTLVQDVADALRAADLPPEQLSLDLAENAVARDPRRVAAQFAELRISGVEVAIDDFGSGYSSLGQLVNIPADVLKVDRSVVAGADGRSTQAAAAIGAVVGLATACGMRSLAEGVETAAQLELAADLGCTFAQGRHIAEPMPADDLERWMRTRARRQPAIA